MKTATPNIKAIKTKYDGYRFRSRLEAKWAVFFDTARIKYEYEPEGFATNGVCYLPDFYLPQFDMYVEVKAPREGYEREIKKAWDSIKWGGGIKKLLVLSNFPKAGDHGQWYFPIIYYGIDGTQSSWWTFNDLLDDEDTDESEIDNYDNVSHSIGCTGFIYEYGDCAKPIGINENGMFYCAIDAKSDIEIRETSWICKKLYEKSMEIDKNLAELETWVPRAENPLFFKALDEARMYQFEKWDRN